ncbi:MAG: sugar ABC transporter ATP-binding protein [Planctomycetaceae bacterium]
MGNDQSSTTVEAALLSLEGVCRSFEGVTALEPLSLSLAAGEILGLVGENGAGKSTLIRLISGVIRPNAGTIRWQGGPVSLNSPREAIDLGIATIHQELEYCGHLTVAENLLLGEPWPRRRGGVDWAALQAEARRRLLDSGFDVPVDCEFSRLTAVEKQEVAIATALARKAKLLVLDEPTASLAAPDVRRLIDHLKRVQATGVTILYVSHRLDEVLDLSTRVAVLRDGALVRVSPIDELDGQALVCDMVGRPLQQVFPRTRSGDTGELLLRVAGLTRAGLFEDVSLEIRAGEVVGLAGLVGAGRSELARAIYGLYGVDAGTMQLFGKPWAPSSPWQALEAGLVYLPEERKRHGLVGDHDLAATLSIGIRDRLSRWGLVRGREERRRVAGMIDRYDIRCTGPGQAVGTLSGGNQQKALFARWLERDPRVLVLDEPTRGVDVGAKAEIHAVIDRLAAAGHGVLLISSDLPEVVGMSDRILVMNRRRLVAELTGESRTEQDVLHAAAGLGESG